MIRRLLLAALLMSSAAVLAQQGGFKRTVLQRTDFGDREVLLIQVEIEPGAGSGRHSHPGVEAGYVVEGESRFEMEGEPARTVKAGDSFIVPVGRVHAATAVTRTKVMATLVVEKGKPLATPAP